MTSPSSVKPSPLLHCEEVYLKMRNEAVENTEVDVPMVVWEGFFTRLVRDLGLAVPYYSTVRNALMGMGCIRQLRRGGGTSPSQWELLKEPTLELWNKMQESGAGKPGAVGSVNAASKSDVKSVRQMVLDLSDRVDSLESNLETLVKMFNDHFTQPKKKGA